MDFVRYGSITTYKRERTVNEIKLLDSMRPIAQRKWVLMEKIHGANFSMKTEGFDYRAASRKEFADDFFGSKELVENFKPTLLGLHDELGGLVEVFGELYGGGYFQSVMADMGLKNHVQRIGKGVYYTPYRAFRCFDIRHNGMYINEGVRQRLCVKHNIPTIPWMRFGDFEELLNHPVQFRSTVPELEGLEEDMNEDNWAEGWILKPVFEMTLGNGKRAMLKGRAPVWAEKAKQPKVKLRQEKTIPAHIKEVLDEFTLYITENRLRSVMSHLGPVTMKEFGKVQGALFQDALKDFNEDDGSIIFPTKQEKRIFNKAAMGPVSQIIRDNWYDIVEGNF